MAPSSLGSKTMGKKLLSDYLRIGKQTKSARKPVSEAALTATHNSGQTDMVPPPLGSTTIGKKLLVNNQRARSQNMVPKLVAKRLLM